jgi:hypothetical protein
MGKVPFHFIVVIMCYIGGIGQAVCFFFEGFLFKKIGSSEWEVPLFFVAIVFFSGFVLGMGHLIRCRAPRCELKEKLLVHA